MTICEFCREKISPSKLGYTFKFTLGKIINGKFTGYSTLYYHKECLDDNTILEEEELTAT